MQFKPEPLWILPWAFFLLSAQVVQGALSPRAYSQSSCRASKSLTWKGFGWRQLRIAAWGVNAADLNESRHQHDERDTHEQDGPPVRLEL